MTEELFRVESVHGEELSFPVSKRAALDQIAQRMEREPLGNPLRVVRVRYRLDPDGPPGPSSNPMRRVWRETVLRFPEIGTLGVCVDKPASQHRKANAGDWSAPIGAKDAEIIRFLWDVFDFHRRGGMIFEETNGRDGFPISEVIFRDKIATRARGWTIRDYTGVFHAIHEHSSAFPLLPTDGPSPC